MKLTSQTSLTKNLILKKAKELFFTSGLKPVLVGDHNGNTNLFLSIHETCQSLQIRESSVMQGIYSNDNSELPDFTFRFVDLEKESLSCQCVEEWSPLSKTALFYLDVSESKYEISTLGRFRDNVSTVNSSDKGIKQGLFRTLGKSQKFVHQLVYMTFKEKEFLQGKKKGLSIMHDLCAGRDSDFCFCNCLTHLKMGNFEETLFSYHNHATQESLCHCFSNP